MKKFQTKKNKNTMNFLEIAKQIPNRNLYRTFKITDEINRDKFALTVPYRFEIFKIYLMKPKRKE